MLECIKIIKEEKGFRKHLLPSEIFWNCEKFYSSLPIKYHIFKTGEKQTDNSLRGVFQLKNSRARGTREGAWKSAARVETWRACGDRRVFRVSWRRDRSWTKQTSKQPYLFTVDWSKNESICIVTVPYSVKSGCYFSPNPKSPKTANSQSKLMSRSPHAIWSDETFSVHSWIFIYFLIPQPSCSPCQ